MQDLHKKIFFIIFLITAFLLTYHFFYQRNPRLNRTLGGFPIDKSTLLRADETGRLFSAIAAAVNPSVVFIKCEALKTAQTPFGQMVKFREQSLGSGIILTKRGHIATNAHVVREAENIMVTLSDRREFSAIVTGLDTASDIAVIQIKAQGLTPAPLADADTLQTGEWVLAIGNPMGLDHSLTFGIVSATGRENPFAAETAEDYIQTDASINPGNSGGPLINLNGEVAGMNTFLVSATGENNGIGFAIPVNLLRFVSESIIKNGFVTRGWLGVELQAINTGLADALKLKTTEGALISRVVSPSPAQSAGLETGDVVLKYGHHAIKTIHDLRKAVMQSEPGRKVVITLFRSGKTLELPAVVGGKGSRPNASGPVKESGKKAVTEYKSRRLGVSVMPSQEEGEETRGLLITESGWDATQNAFPHVGDIILKINSKTVNSLAEFKAAEKELDSGEETLLLLSREGSVFFTAVQTK